MSHKVSLNPSKKKNSYVNHKTAIGSVPSKKGKKGISNGGSPFSGGGTLPDVLPPAPFPHLKGKP